MKYEIKHISLSSVLRMTMLISITVGTILLTFSNLILLRLFSGIGNIYDEMSGFDLPDISGFSFTGIILTSLLSGIILSVLLVLVVSLIIIFYNFFAGYIGGIEIYLENLNQSENIVDSEQNDTIEN